MLFTRTLSIAPCNPRYPRRGTIIRRYGSPAGMTMVALQRPKVMKGVVPVLNYLGGSTRVVYSRIAHVVTTATATPLSMVEDHDMPLERQR